VVSFFCCDGFITLCETLLDLLIKIKETKRKNTANRGLPYKYNTTEKANNDKYIKMLFT
jgi:hypothetical protein